MRISRALAALSLIAFTAAAEDSPEEVAHTYINALSEQRLTVVVDYMHPSALDHFKSILVDIGDAIERAPANRRPPEKMLNALFGDDGLKNLKQAEPRELFVGFMTNLMTFVPQIKEMTAGSEYQILGHVEEGNLAHVVFRATLKRGNAKVTKMDVVSVKRDGLSWKVLLTDDLSNLVAGLGRQLASPPKEEPAPMPPPPGPVPRSTPMVPMAVRPIPEASSPLSPRFTPDAPATPPPAATPEPEATPKVTTKAGQKSKTGATTKAAPSPAAKVTPTAAAKSTPAAKTKAEPTPTPKVAAKATPKGTSKATPTPAPSPTPHSKKK